MALGIQAQIVARMQHDLPAARRYREETAHLGRLSGNRWVTGILLVSLSAVAYIQKDYAATQSLLEQAVPIFRELRNAPSANIVRSGMADIARSQRDYARALVLYKNTLLEWQRLGNRGAIARCLECFALIAMAQAQTEPPEVRTERLLRAARLFAGAKRA